MKSLSFILTALFFLSACNTATVQVDLPPAPASMDAVKKMITGKKYNTEKLAQVSNLVADKNDPYEWFEEMKDTTAFFRNYRDKRMKFSVQFVNDTAAVITDEAGTNNGAWSIDDQPGEKETPGIFLRLSVTSEEKLFPGQTGFSTLTSTYKILGMNDKQLFLQTPNMFNMRKMAVLLKAE